MQGAHAEEMRRPSATKPVLLNTLPVYSLQTVGEGFEVVREAQ